MINIDKIAATCVLATVGAVLIGEHYTKTPLVEAIKVASFVTGGLRVSYLGVKEIYHQIRELGEKEN